MVRSLLIRQVFRLVDALLALAVCAVIALSIMQYLSPMPEVEVDEALTQPVEVETDALVSAAAERSAYDSLVKSGLFGPAGRWDPKAAPPPPPPASEPEPIISEDIADSELSLTLKGTIALEPGNPFSVAFIENTESRNNAKSIAYRIGQDILENVQLELVYAREVILLNKRKDPPQRERLRMEDKLATDATGAQTDKGGDGKPAPPQPRAAAAPPAASAMETITLDREEMYNEIAENTQALLQMQPKFVQNDAGEVIGVTVDGLGKQPLAQKLGFQDNDVLQTVNNEKVDSQEKIMELMMKYQNANSFRIGVMRDGKPRVMNFRLN